MKLLLTISGFLLIVSGSVCVDITVRGTEGEQVTIKCPYDGGYENSYKYFYKGPYQDNNLILKSYGEESSVFNGRFSLRDDHQMRSFTVTIRNLRMADAGEYGCVAGWGEYKLIQLNVIRAPQKRRPVQISTSTLHPGSFVIVVTAEALVLLLIGLPLIIVSVWKKKKNKGLQSSSTEEFNPVIYEQMKDAGHHCNPEDRDTETTVVYSCVS